MLKLNLEKDAQKFLSKLGPKQALQISKKILELQEGSKLSDTKKLTGYAFSRVDAGEYRIIYFIQKGVLYIPLIGKRNDGEVYKRLARLVQ